MRGKQNKFCHFEPPIRITPAGAGKTNDEMVELYNR